MVGKRKGGKKEIRLRSRDYLKERGASREKTRFGTLWVKERTSLGKKKRKTPPHERGRDFPSIILCPWLANGGKGREKKEESGLHYTC